MNKMQTTALDIFNTMADRFRPEGAKGLDASIGFVLKDKGNWRLEIRDAKMALEKTDCLDPCTLTLTTTEAVFLGMHTGQIEPMEAITSRRLILEGDMDLFARFSGLFMKFVPPGASQAPEQELVVLKKTISMDQDFSTGPEMGRFLKALKDKVILAIQCPECGRLQSPPREACALCRVRNRQWRQIGPKGELRMMEYCYYSSPDPLTGQARPAPYGAVGILLDGCRDEEVFWHLLRPDQLDQAKMGIVMGGRVERGSRVRPVWADIRTGSIEDILYFELDH